MTILPTWLKMQVGSVDEASLGSAANHSQAPAHTLSGEPQGGALRRRGGGTNPQHGAVPVRGLSRGKFALLALAASAAAGIAFAWHAVAPLGAEIARAEAVSVTVLDRNGHLLRAFTTPDARWRLPVEPHAVDPRYLAMLRAFEDRRFDTHKGIDPWALGRAAHQLASNLRIVSGGSTLTMQTARLLDGDGRRSSIAKLRQIVRAVALERRLSKTEVLRLYLRLAPFGGNVEGLRAASLAYLGKEPRRLSVAEAALLVALPQSPEMRRPDRFPELARLARNRVLRRVAAVGVITADELAEALREPVPRVRREFPRLAPHLSEAEVRRDPRAAQHQLTIDRDVQARLEVLAREHAQALGPRLSVALLAVEHRTGEIVAHVGSPGHLDDTRLGAIDMTAAVRSPGSTLKPLIYGLAFEQGLAHPETLIEDRPARFGSWAPKNFDEDFHGTVTVREALAQSLNVPAVKVLAAVGPARLVGRLRRARAMPVLGGARTEPTLAIALGGIGMRLSDLATVYSALARGGEAVRLTHRQDEPRARGVIQSRRLLSPVAARYVADILKDAPPPANARGGLAYKTGTSYGYRDAWSVGFDGRHVIAVWVGRADATATPGLTGRGSAAPILFDAFARVAERRSPLAAAPQGASRQSTGSLPPPLRRFSEPGDEQTAQGPWLEPPVQIAFPPDRAVLEAEAADPETLVLKAEGGALPLTWLVDGAPIEADPARREAVWQPAGRGFARISVIDARGRVDRVDVRVK